MAEPSFSDDRFENHRGEPAAPRRHAGRGRGFHRRHALPSAAWRQHAGVQRVPRLAGNPAHDSRHLRKRVRLPRARHHPTGTPTDSYPRRQCAVCGLRIPSPARCHLRPDLAYCAGRPAVQPDGREAVIWRNTGTAAGVPGSGSVYITAILGNALVPICYRFW